MKLELSLSTNSNPTLSLSNPYVVYFEFWYRLGLSPFKLSVCHKTGECRVVQAGLKRRILNIIWIAVSCIYTFTCFHRMDHFFEPKKGGVQYFLSGVGYGVVLLESCYFVSIWLKSKSFEELANFCEAFTETHKYASEGARQTRWIMWVVLTKIPLFSLLSLMEKYSWSFEKIYTAEFCEIGQEVVFFMSIDREKIDFFPKLLLGLTGFFFSIAFDILKGAALSLVLISMNVGRRYLLCIRGGLKLKSPAEVVKEFLRLKYFLRKNRNAVGLLSFGIVTRYFPLLFILIPEILKPNGLFQLWRNVWSPTILIVILTFTAWFTNEANNSFEEWLCEDKNLLRLQEPYLSLILHHLGNGGFQYEAFGFIKFTSAFLGQIVCLAFTFAAVIIQFQTGD